MLKVQAQNVSESEVGSLSESETELDNRVSKENYIQTKKKKKRARQMHILVIISPRFFFLSVCIIVFFPTKKNN